MNVLSYIIPNILIALILIVGVINGQKRGWKKSLIKLTYTVVLAVGTFFLSNYLIMPALVGIESIGTYLLVFPTAIWMLVFAVTMGLASLIFTIVCHKMDKTRIANKKAVKAVKHEDITKKSKEAKAQEKEENHRRKVLAKKAKREEAKAWRKAHKVSRAFGGIIGAVVGVVISLLMMLTVGNTAIGIAFTSLDTVDEKTMEVTETIHSFYDHSVYGLIDGAINGEDGTYEMQLLLEEIKIIGNQIIK